MRRCAAGVRGTGAPGYVVQGVPQGVVYMEGVHRVGTWQGGYMAGRVRTGYR